jgi:SAM-dependent methyltransferase
LHYAFGGAAYSETMSQREAWERIAAQWVELVRSEGSDSAPENWTPFLELIPPPGRLTIELGCGEGRIARALRTAGHTVVGIDSAATMIHHAREADPTGDYRVGDAAALPLESDVADLVVAFMSLQDMDDHVAATREVARTLTRGGRFCLAVIHPFWSAGSFEPDDPEGTFRIENSYFETLRHLRPVLNIPSVHRPLEAYTRATEEAGLLIEAVRELPARPRLPGRFPIYLHLRAIKR